MPRTVSRIVAAAALVTALVAGCSSDGNGQESQPSKAPKPDVSGLDTGEYSKNPRKLGTVASEAEGRLVEAIRMGELVTDFRGVHSSLTTVYNILPMVEAEDAATSLSFTDEPVVKGVLEQYGMICGYLALAGSDDQWDIYGTGSPKPNTKVVKVLLARFPDAESARNAAIEMDAADFAVNPNNVPVPIAKYPDAHGHWDPNVASMAASLAHGDFVIHVTSAIQTDDPVLEPLKFLVEKAFDADLPLIDDFSPTPVDQLSRLPRDPDGLLGRMFDLTPGAEPEISLTYTVLGRNSTRALQTASFNNATAFDSGGIDRKAIWSMPGNGNVSFYRARDKVGAQQYLASRLDDDLNERPIDAPAAVPGAKCFELGAAEWAEDASARYGCWVTYDRYLVWVSSANEADLQLRAASQYALLVNDL